MANQIDISFIDYLSAKKSIDNCALNMHVLESLKIEVLKYPAFKPIKVLEVGAGIGTMIERLVDMEVFTNVEYTAIDSQLDNILHAKNRIKKWANNKGYETKNSRPEYFKFINGEFSISIHFKCVDFYAFSDGMVNKKNWDLIIAHAFLDLVHLPSALPALFRLLNQNGLFYFTLNFDGVTILEPVIDPELDQRILKLYHQSMDNRLTNGKPAGSSQTGRLLFSHIKNCGAVILDAGASDWIVFLQYGRYTKDEICFLQFIIQTIDKELKDHPLLDSKQLSEWTNERRNQISHTELVYIAHQIDFLGKFVESTCS